MYRWDAEHALGAANPLPPVLAAEGVTEVLDTFVPRQVQRRRLRPPSRAVRLTATDTDSSWLLGPGEPVAAASAPTETLLLTLWHRVPTDDPAIGWTGDHVAGQSLLRAPLVP